MMKNFKRKTGILLFVLCQIFTSVMGQNNSDFEEAVVEPYLDYYALPQEQVYTHFNKSSYLPGDAIWFKCYAFNPKTKRPSIVTKNLIVELYRPDGKLVEQKILRVEQGVADHAFFLDLKDTVGVYTFRAYTNWMKHFDDTLSFSSYVNVLGPQQADTVANNKIDVQFLPESGTLLQGLTNKVGIKAIDANGKGIQLSGEIIDEHGTIITSFELNKLGMGRVSLNLKEHTRLNCRINLAEKSPLIYSLPQPEKQGIVAMVNQKSDKIFINTATNKETLLTEQTFYLMVHNKGIVQFIYAINLSPDKNNSLAEFDKSDFLNGLNCLTVFNADFEPVAERLFYINNAKIKGEVREDYSFRSDTLLLNLTSLDSEGNPIAADLSLSVLPGGTKSNNFTTSLLAEVLLKSGLKGFIENPNYYFKGNDSLRLTDLDNLLITQGWRKYNWTLITDNTPKDFAFEMENGFQVNGHVERWSKNRSKADYQVFMHSSDNRIFKISPVDSLGAFEFNNLYFYDSTRVYLTVLNKNGRNMAIKVNDSLAPVYKSNSFIQKPKHITTNPTTDFSDLSKFFSSDIMIDEIKVYDKKPEPPNASNIFNANNEKTFTITDENVDKYTTVTNLLRQEFGVSRTVVIDPNTNKPKHVFYMNRGLNSIKLEHKVILIIDDIPIEMGDLNEWEDLSVYCSIADIESISVNKTGFGLGMRGVDGAIIIKTRTTPVFSKVAQTIVNKLEVRGYSSPVAYYTPKYKLFPTDPDYIKYATVFWQPNVLTDQEGKATIKFPVPPDLDALEIRMEGYADNGALFLENKMVTINRKHESN